MANTLTKTAFSGESHTFLSRWFRIHTVYLEKWSLKSRSCKR